MMKNWTTPKWIGLAFICVAPALAMKTIVGALLAAFTGWIFLGGAAQIKNELGSPNNCPHCGKPWNKDDDLIIK